MKLHYTPTSPFARKCIVCAHELDLRERLELVPANPHPVARDRALVELNPLGQVPTLVADDGTALYDSRVICEYLNELAGGDLIPGTPGDRWPVLVEQSLADGISGAALLTRYEMAVRPEPQRWSGWIEGQLDKVACGLTDLERRAVAFADRVDLGTIAFACALGYLDFRFASLNWRERHPNTAAWFEWFGGRDAMVTTRPPAA